MSSDPGEKIFTFVAVRPDGAMPALHLASCRNETDARRQAAAWLSTHASCERVEIWSEREHVADVSLADATDQFACAAAEAAKPAPAAD